MALGTARAIDRDVRAQIKSLETKVVGRLDTEAAGYLRATAARQRLVVIRIELAEQIARHIDTAAGAIAEIAAPAAVIALGVIPCPGYCNA